jgi:two-component system, OmpR family, sensor histidine kinase BaeS
MTQSETAFVTLSISDSGPGIPKEALPHIGERFYRTDFARTRKYGGTGLGIAISKAIIAKHGGSMKIESEFGQGTTITIKLPLNQQ